MPVVDVALVLLMLIAVLNGSRRGFLVAMPAFAGLCGGALAGVWIGPLIADQFTSPGTKVVVGLGVIVVLAVLGNALAGLLSAGLRGTVEGGPARRPDRVAGAVAMPFAVLLVAYLVAVPLGLTPSPSTGTGARGSVILDGVGRAAPERIRALAEGLRDPFGEAGLTGRRGELVHTSADHVAAPDPGLAESRVVAASRRSVVKVLGTASGCGRALQGSGFVYADERVLTNAHVVAGTSSVEVETVDGRLRAEVVIYDPKRDLAVLRIPGLSAPQLRFARSPVPAGSDAIVLGFPMNGPYDAQSARVQDRDRLTVPDIYHAGSGIRETYSFRALVRTGNSGGPLMDPGGDVLGVVFATSDDRSVGFALTAAEAAAVADLGTRRTRAVRTGACV